MDMERKVNLVMNLMYNLLLAVVLSAIAEIINAGGVSFPAIIFDIVISFDAKDRNAVYERIVGKVSALYPEYQLQIALDTDFTEE